MNYTDINENKCNENGNVINDLFSHIETLPEEVQKIISYFEIQEPSYNNCEQLKYDLEKLGYTFEFGLDAIPFNLQKIQQKWKI